MLRSLLILVGVALVTPFGAFEDVEDVVCKIYQEVVQSSSDEITAASEGEAEDLELFFNGALAFVHHARIDGRLPLFWGDSAPTAKVDPQGCRPPPRA